MKTFANRIKELRDKNGLSQAQLAKRIGVKTQTVSLWEREQRSPSKQVLTKLSEYFNVRIAYLTGESDDDSPIQEIVDLAKKIEVEADIEELAMIFSRLCQLSPSMRSIVSATISAAYRSDKDNQRLTPIDLYEFSIRSTFRLMKDEEPVKNLQYPEDSNLSEKDPD